jgi:hypothetical protein
LSVAVETEVLELLERLNEDDFECSCCLARRVGWTPRQAFEAIARLWVDGKAEHRNGKWRITGETR